MDKAWFGKWFAGTRKPRTSETQSQADNGDAEAQFSVGARLAGNGSTEPDFSQAVRWYRRAAEQNHAAAQFHLGLLYADGRGVPRDNGQAMLWISRAAQLGHPEAQHQLGLRHRRASFNNLRRNELESNLEAFKWFRLAANQGHKPSEVELGMISLSLTREQVNEGNQRAAAFAADGQSAESAVAA